MIEPLILTSFTTVNALGRGCAATLSALQDCRSGLRRCDFDGCEIETFVGQVDGVDEAAIRGPLRDFDCRNNRLALMALQTDGFDAAVADAVQRYGPDRIAVLIGSSTSGVHEGELAYRRRDPETGVLPASFCFHHTHDFFSISDFVRRTLGLSGPTATVTTACSSSAKAFVDAWQLIHMGLCDAAVVGGVDSLTLLCLFGFHSLELLSTEPCRPNDRDRTGISIGEAAGFALVEKADAARRQQAGGPMVALSGYGESTDAYHMSSPHPTGEGAETAMRAALERAGLDPADIDYVNLHGTGTIINDQVEARAASAVFGADVPCSSTKGWTGHTLGAAGITEAVIAGLCIAESFLPGNLNMRTPDPAFACRLVEDSRAQPVRRVLSNSFGFGGNNSSLILEEVA